MNSRDKLIKSIEKSLTSHDETSNIIKDIDAVISEEIESTDRLLLAEIAQLELELSRCKAESDEWSQKFTALQIEVNLLKEAFVRE